MIDLINQLMSNGGVCRTALATSGSVSVRMKRDSLSAQSDINSQNGKFSSHTTLNCYMKSIK